MFPVVHQKEEIQIEQLNLDPQGGTQAEEDWEHGSLSTILRFCREDEPYLIVSLTGFPTPQTGRSPLVE